MRTLRGWLQANAQRVLGLAVPLTLAGVSLHSAGCLSLSSQQCSTQADCPQSYVCSASSNICVKAESGNATPRPVAAGDPCSDTSECVAKSNGEPSICRKNAAGGTCVNLKSADCTEVIGKWEDPNAIFVASISQARTSDVTGDLYGGWQESGMHLAMAEIQAQNAGINGVNGGPKRPLVEIDCSVESLKSEGQREVDGQRISDHLTNNVGITAAFIVDEHSSKYVTTPLANAGTFTMCGGCQTARNPAEHKGLVWAGLPPYPDQKDVWQRLLHDAEGRVRANPAYGVGTNGAVRVALSASPKNEYRVGLAEVVQETIRWNGDKGLKDNLPNFLRTENEYWATPNSSPTVYASAQAIAAFKPHVVLVADDIEGAILLMPLVESLWNSSQPPPHYVVDISQFAPSLTQLVGTNDNLRKRIAGLIAAPDPESTNNFVGLAQRVLPYVPDRFERTVDFAAGAAGFYEWFYSTVYAIAAANPGPDGKPSGSDIRQAFGRLTATNGAKINLDGKQSTFVSALTTLASGLDIDLIGTYSNLAWDVSRNVNHFTTSSFCLARDPQTQNSYIIFSDPTQRAPGAPVTGTLSCY